MGDESREAPPPMFTDSQMAWLRRAVIGMGLVLLLGFAVVIGRVVWLLNRPGAEAQRAPGAVATGPAPALKPEARLALPAGAVVRHVSLSDRRLAVHFEGPKGAAIAILDLETGAVVQRVELAPER